MLWLALAVDLCVRLLLLDSSCSHRQGERAGTLMHLCLTISFPVCGKVRRGSWNHCYPCFPRLSKCQVLDKQETPPSYTLPTKQINSREQSICDAVVQTGPRNPGVCVSDRGDSHVAICAVEPSGLFVWQQQLNTQWDWTSYMLLFPLKTL